MTKTQMPEPVAHAVKAANTGKICSLYLAGDDAAFSGVYLMEKKHIDDLITITKAEAYAEVRVREALEEAAKICWEMQSAPEFGKDDKDHWLAIAERRIRALIPPTKNEAEE